jgi:hypothetical protein
LQGTQAPQQKPSVKTKAPVKSNEKTMQSAVVTGTCDQDNFSFEEPGGVLPVIDATTTDGEASFQ